MYTIGQFAVISGVSAKALRHYDEIDLFSPHTVDKENNYRYYHKQQITKINTIKELKSFGLSLEQIKDTISNKSLKSTLAKQLIALDTEIKLLEHKKDLINKKLSISNPKSIEKQNYVIAMQKVEGYKAICVKDTIQIKDISSLISRLYELGKNHNAQIINTHKLRVLQIDNELCRAWVFAEFKNSDTVPVANTCFVDAGLYLTTVHSGVANKTAAYTAVFDYANDQRLNIDEIPIEEISIIGGKLNTSIYFKIVE